MTYKFYIKLKNGEIFEHPMAASNFVDAYPHVDLEALPDWVIPFERVDRPEPSFLEVVEPCKYVIENGIAKDYWVVRQMTAEEKSIKIAKYRLDMANDGRASWILNEETGESTCPVNKPLDGKKYEWDDVNVRWVQVS